MHPKYRFLDPPAGPTTLVDLLPRAGRRAAGRPRLHVSGRRRVRRRPSDLRRARPAGPRHRRLAHVAGSEGPAGPAALPARARLHRGVLRLPVCRGGRGAGLSAAAEPRAVPHPGDRRRRRRDGRADHRRGPGAGQAADRSDPGPESAALALHRPARPRDGSELRAAVAAAARSPATRWRSCNTPRARRARPRA